MEGFSIDSAAGHPFLRVSDQALLILLEAAGYDLPERRQLLRTIRSSFKGALQEVLSGEYKEKFAGFTQWLELDTDDRRLSRDLLAYADQQRADLEDRPALGIEPFAVADVLIETECGILTWREIRDEKQDPFKEFSAPREDLMAAVLKRMGLKSFNDAMVIQGAPGAGKSTFTKQLCKRLSADGFTPVRIPMQFLPVNLDLFDAVRHVVVNQSGAPVSFRAEVFREKVFTERVSFGEGEISPYVFIFDGWDEISLSADEGFQARVERLLDSIRSTFLSQNRNRVRVILTGRPSEAVGRTGFLSDETPVMTIRPIRPDQLDAYANALVRAIRQPAFSGDEVDHWKSREMNHYQPALDEYKNKANTVEVLGQPLLAHLAMKVMTDFEGPVSELIAPSTTLYRHLVDMTCKRGGKYLLQAGDSNKSGRIEGRDLRALLHGTALAVTAHGSESIPMEELELRLETLGVGNEVFEVTKQHPLTNLMFSFYFKNVHEQSGCEFLHYISPFVST
jgi:hypothetical protein